MRNIVITLVLLAAVALLLPNLEILAFQGQGDGGQSEIQRGFQIAPVQLSLTGKSRGLVGLGELSRKWSDGLYRMPYRGLVPTGRKPVCWRSDNEN